MQLPTALPSPSPKKTKKSTSKRNLLALILKKFLIFSKESFSYVFPNETLRFSPQARKIKETYPKKISYASGNENPPIFFYIFSKEGFSYISGNRDPEKVPYISGNGSPEKTSYI